jgi:hypothetical protein
MKVYLIKESDIDNLLLKLNSDPKYGINGGSIDSTVRDNMIDITYEKVRRFYNYQVRNWIDSIKKE